MKNVQSKLLVVFIIVSLLFSVMAINAFADDTVVARIGDDEYTSLGSAVESASQMTGDVTITLTANIVGENVTIARSSDLNLIIDGNNNTFNGAITVDGKSATLANGSLTIRNVNFDATDITKAACVNFGGSNATRYVTNVTLEDCTFTGGNRRS